MGKELYLFGICPWDTGFAMSYFGCLISNGTIWKTEINILETLRKTCIIEACDGLIRLSLVQLWLVISETEVDIVIL